MDDKLKTLYYEKIILIWNVKDDIDNTLIQLITRNRFVGPTSQWVLNSGNLFYLHKLHLLFMNGEILKGYI